MISLNQILVVVAVILLLWRGQRMIKTVQEQFARLQRNHEAPEPDNSEPVELVKCANCGTYVARGRTCSCGHKNT